MTEQTNKHTWCCFRTGGLDQVHLRSGSDIDSLEHLDQKLWTALSCPVQGVHFDNATMKLLDSDKDGRVRVPEILQAVAWLKTRLASLDSLLSGTDAVRLAHLNSKTAEGQALLATSKRILKNLDKANADVITLSDVTDTAKIFVATEFNGDGIITADAAQTPETATVINEIIAAFGAETDRNGKPGVNQKKVDAFFKAVVNYLAWSAQTKSDATILVLGEATATAFEALAAVRAKVDDYFTRCRLAAFDTRAAQALGSQDAGFVALANQMLTDAAPDMANLPLAQIEANRDLPLLCCVNPYWANAMVRLREAVVVPLLGTDKTALSSEEWHSLKAKLAPFEAWNRSKIGTEIEGLGVERLTALAKSTELETITALIARDAALETENAQITEVERLVRYHANLGRLLQNYVNMAQLYNPDATAIFQVGTLYMDARACELCFHVADAGAHAALSTASKCCLVYCNLTRAGATETKTVCAAFTAGFAQNLWVGRNGIFYDLDGKDWDATIIKIVENPISIKEAFWSPWRKIAEMIGAQVNKLLSAKQDAALAAAAKKIETVGAAEAAPAADAPKKMEGAALASSVAALGIAVGLIASAVGGLVSIIVGLPLWKLLIGVVAVVLAVSGPSMILAAFKLRARDLAPILSACGWAINRRLRFSLRLGRLFTREATLPPGSVRELQDPYADKNALRNTIIVVLAVAVLAGALWYKGILDSILPYKCKRNPPAPAPVAEAHALAPQTTTE